MALQVEADYNETVLLLPGFFLEDLEFIRMGHNRSFAIGLIIFLVHMVARTASGIRTKGRVGSNIGTMVRELKILLQYSSVPCLTTSSRCTRRSAG